MKKLMTMARQFRDDENGAAMVEYSILVGIIAGGRDPGHPRHRRLGSQARSPACAPRWSRRWYL